MKCKRCWKVNPAEVHTCTPYMYYKGVNWTYTLPDWSKATFTITDVQMDINMIVVKLTSWEYKWKYSILYFNEIDDNLKFNLEN